MRLRLLNYCVQVWLQWRSRHEREPRLPLIVPLVFSELVGYDSSERGSAGRKAALKSDGFRALSGSEAMEA